MTSRQKDRASRSPLEQDDYANGRRRRIAARLDLPDSEERKMSMRRKAKTCLAEIPTLDGTTGDEYLTWVRWVRTWCRYTDAAYGTRTLDVALGRMTAHREPDDDDN